MPDDREEFFFDVPSHVAKLVIQEGVTFSGGLRVGYRKPDQPLVIEGRNRQTSVLFGTKVSGWTDQQRIAESDKWKYGSISVLADATVSVRNLTSLNPRGYHISGYANASVIHLENCRLIDDRPGDNNNSDGFHGASGSTIRDSFISTSDDAIKIYRDLEISNVTIHQGRNGAAIQLGWGGESDVAQARIENLTILGTAPDGLYNMAPITWEAGEAGRREFEIKGLRVAATGKMYDEVHSRWIPLGLFEIKPSQCILNLRATGVEIDIPSLGLHQSKGSLQLEGKVRLEREE